MSKGHILVNRCGALGKTLVWLVVWGEGIRKNTVVGTGKTE